MDLLTTSCCLNQRKTSRLPKSVPKAAWELIILHDHYTVTRCLFIQNFQKPTQICFVWQLQWQWQWLLQLLQQWLLFLVARLPLECPILPRTRFRQAPNRRPPYAGLLNKTLLNASRIGYNNLRRKPNNLSAENCCSETEIILRNF